MHLTLSFELNFFELLLQCWMVNLGCGFGGQDGSRAPALLALEIGSQAVPSLNCGKATDEQTLLMILRVFSLQ